MKVVVGIDVGTNSIGWAILINDEKGVCFIDQAGSRIIPMDAMVLGNFDKGNSTSQTSERTRFRIIRRLYERCILRRERLHRVLNILGFLPEHYARQIDFVHNSGKFIKGTEPKLAWTKDPMGNNVFLFQESFHEMLADFARHHPGFLSNGRKVPYDWTLYYLRKKALTQSISKEELAWILLNFNQKRGYYQLRGAEEVEEKNKQIEYRSLKVIKVEATEDKKGKGIWYNIYLENGWLYRRSSSVSLKSWEGMTKDFIVTTELNDDGTPKKDKQGAVKRSFRAPNEDDWMLLKVKTENDINASHKTIGEYIYDTLLERPQQKIRGKLVRTVERKFYKDELRRILEVQATFHPELQDRALLVQCIQELYPHNEGHRNLITGRDFIHLFIDDILFYQRPLKSKKSLVGNCPYESHKGIDKETGEIKEYGVKCIAKSHPLYQEFRLWQFLSYLRIYQKEKYVDGKLKTDVDVTNEFITSEEEMAALFEWLNERKNIDQKSFLKYPPFGLKKNAQNEYRWNYVEDKTYPCNETHAAISTRLAMANISVRLSPQVEEHLWHLLYSISDKEELRKALTIFANKQQWETDSFVESFIKMPPFEKDYGAYSAKAIKKLLPLMRLGKYWSEEAIDTNTRMRIEKLIHGEADERIEQRTREKTIHLKTPEQFKGLPPWLACYIVYDRHSEAQEITRWESPADIDRYLNNFHQHSLHNPIVEQIVLETLRVVRDIWKKTGQIDEIHIELGRNMKETASKRAQQTARTIENENTNLRIKALLAEFVNSEFGIESVRPHSLSQQNLLRIYEEAVLQENADQLPDDITDFLKKLRENKQPTRNEFIRYKCWLEQKYCSPYTGEIIPLSKLFTPAYEIEHIIPKARFFDDSFSNKVICEAAVNKLKDKQLGYEFIKNHHGQRVETGFGGTVQVFTEEAYEAFVKDHYRNNRTKMKKLLMEDIPDKFIERQLNDSRYISTIVKCLLSNIVREKDGQGDLEQEAISKNVIVCTGGITDRLKKDWGLNDVWNDFVAPRFERLNRLSGKTCFGHWEQTEGKRFFRTELPLEYQRGFSKKRIDHRHHAMDAIVIACATRNHINYLNNESARKDAKISRGDLQRLLCDKRGTDDKGNYNWIIRKPWKTFTQDVRQTLENIIISFKQNLRVINKCTNHYTRYDANGEKIVDKQRKGDSWAIRKPLHKDTVFGRVNLRKVREVRLSLALEMPQMIVDKKLKTKILQLIAYKYDKKRIERYFKENTFDWKGYNLSKIPVYYYTDTIEPLVASRKPLDTSFTEKKIRESVTDTGIQKILFAHLADKNNKAELAFSPEGIEEMNRNLLLLNSGKPHQPIYKVRVYEPLGNKFPVGESGNKTSKYVEAAKGTNLFFAIYATADGKRTYATLPLHIVIEREKQGLKPVPEQDEAGNQLLFWLSPNDLVYLPTPEEIETGRIGEIDKRRIYKMVSSTGNQCFFIPASVSNGIIQTLELGANNKAEKSWEGEMIKSICLPLKVDRLGNIIQVGKPTL